MNKKGQVMMGILFAVMIFICGMLIFNLMTDVVTDARTDLDCANGSSISDGTKLVCLITNGVIPYWIIAIVSFAGGAIMSKLAI